MTTIESPTAPPKPIGWTQRQVQNFASDAAKKWGYTANGDIYPVVTMLGGRIEMTDWFSPQQTGRIKVSGPGDFLIQLSPFSGETRRLFTIAHELGHYVLHSQFGKFPLEISRHGSDRVEWEANWFAAGFLMPATEFRNLVNQGWNEAEIATRFKVSEAAVGIRKTVLGL